MWIIELLKESFKGRGFYPISMSIFSWACTAMLILIIFCELILYLFRVKYKNSKFKNTIKKEANKEEDQQ